MALHMTGLVSRHNLAHPDEKPVVKPVYEKVLKFNPNHDKAGRFATGSGGSGKSRRGGGTFGPPTEDAFGNPMRSRHARATSAEIAADKSNWTPGKSFAQHQADKRSRRGGPAGGQFASDKTGVTPHVQEAQYAKSHMHGTSDGGYGPKGGSIESGSLRSRSGSDDGGWKSGGYPDYAAHRAFAEGKTASTRSSFDKAADAIKAHNDAVGKDKTTGNQDEAYDAIMAARRRKSKR